MRRPVWYSADVAIAPLTSSLSAVNGPSTAN